MIIIGDPMNDIFIYIPHILFELTSVAVITNSMAYLGGKIILRNYNRANGIVKNFCPVDPQTVEERKKAISKEKMDEVKDYIEKLANYTKEENLKTVYKNLKNLKIKRKPLLLISGTAGTYDAKKNYINYIFKSSIGHEFLHLASADYDPKKKEYQVGFSQRRKSAVVGKGLNEGYTELLASRIYNKENKVEAYKELVKLTELLEYFFDDPKEIEKYYFNHDLPGFIHRMEQYIPRKEFLDIIKGMDKLLLYSSLPISPFPTYEFFKIQMKLYYWFNAQNHSSLKRSAFEQAIQKNAMGSILLKKQKLKLQREFQKGTPVFKESKRANPLYYEVKTDEYQIPIELERQRKVLEELLPYQKDPFSKICSEVFQTPVNEINILHATKLYCMMTGIKFPKDRKELNSYCRQVQSLILPENEKSPLDYRVERQLQKKIDTVWYEYYLRNRGTELSKPRKIS